LTAEDWHFVLRCKRLEEILKYLGGTDYADVLSHLPEGKPDPEAVTLVLYDQLFKEYSKVLRSVPRPGALFLRALLSRYEAENVKTILRGVWSAMPASEIRFFMYRLGGLSRMPFRALLQAEKIGACIELLKPTIFYTPLVHAIPQFEAQNRLFPLEVAIDMAAFEYIVVTLRSLTRGDRRHAEVLIGALVDSENLCWLVRFRHIYGLSAEESINYILAGGARLGIRDLATLARSPDLSSFLQTLPEPYGDVLRQAKDWPEIRPLLDKWFVVQLWKVFHRDPFQIALQVSYLLVKEMEIRALEGLVGASDLGLPTGRSIEFLSLPIAGGVRV
jgi:V/A-type H+-transporting ATPase subunit C